MTDAKQLIDRLDREHTLTVDEYEYLITAQTDELAEYAASLADKRRREIYKNEVFVRGQQTCEELLTLLLNENMEALDELSRVSALEQKNGAFLSLFVQRSLL